MTWLPQTAPGATSFARVLGLCPELYADYTAFADRFGNLPGLDSGLLELCRTRVAQTLGSQVPADGALPGAPQLSAARRAALDDWRCSDAFSAAERACLALAEKFVLDPRGVSDEDFAAVTAQLSTAATVALVEALALFDGFTRLRIILGTEPSP